MLLIVRLVLAKESEPPFREDFLRGKWGLVFRLEFLFLFLQGKRK
jgi:hypothetical protein